MMGTTQAALGLLDRDMREEIVLQAVMTLLVEVVQEQLGQMALSPVGVMVEQE